MISGLTKSCYIISSTQIISAIHWFILKIKQILKSQDLKGHSYIWPRPYTRNFKLSWHLWACKKSAQIIHLFLRYSRAPMTLETIPIFDHVHPIMAKPIFDIRDSCPFLTRTNRKIIKVILNFLFLTSLITN